MIFKKKIKREKYYNPNSNVRVNLDTGEINIYLSNCSIQWMSVISWYNRNTEEFIMKELIKWNLSEDIENRIIKEIKKYKKELKEQNRIYELKVKRIKYKLNIN